MSLCEPGSKNHKAAKKIRDLTQIKLENTYWHNLIKFYVEYCTKYESRPEYMKCSQFFKSLKRNSGADSSA